MKREPDRPVVPVATNRNMNMHEICTQEKARKYLGDYQPITLRLR